MGDQDRNPGEQERIRKATGAGEPAADDTEGQGWRSNKATEGTDSPTTDARDTEGHRILRKGGAPGGE